ncbi:hypothetical protein [Paenibacillus harenae]|uniref:hypothetical protein n=1 Tax=Paenibacillus harenae TaxID=306543 RepID=UPI00278F50CA|nr:hypothetical protein [Paenibacillus harenae]MDQ0058409.1 hypothetical protein [Paenibacillus harenae]
MNKSYAYAVVAALLSLAIGACYVGDVFFDYGFLGPEIGSEGETVQLWGYVSIGLSIVLLAAVICAMNAKLKWTNYVLLGILFLLCFIQLPPVFLWLFVMLLGEWGAGVSVLLHCLVLVAMIGSVRAMRRALVVS